MTDQLESHMDVTRQTLGKEQFEEACLAFGLPINREGYGFLRVVTPDGRRRTRATRDVEYHRLHVESLGHDLGAFDVPKEVYPLYRWGWPGADWASPTNGKDWWHELHEDGQGWSTRSRLARLAVTSATSFMLGAPSVR